MPDYKAALDFLHKLDQEERNWRAARADVGILLANAVEAQKTIEEARKEKATYEESIKGLAKQLENGNARVARDVEELERQERAALNERLESSRVAVKEIEEAIEAARKVKVESDEAAKQARAKLEKVEKELADVEGRLAEAHAAIGRLTTAI